MFEYGSTWLADSNATNEAFVKLIRTLHDKVQRAAARGRHNQAARLEARRQTAIGWLNWRRRVEEAEAAAARREYPDQFSQRYDNY